MLHMKYVYIFLQVFILQNTFPSDVFTLAPLSFAEQAITEQTGSPSQLIEPTKTSELILPSAQPLFDFTSNALYAFIFPISILIFIILSNIPTIQSYLALTQPLFWALLLIVCFIMISIKNHICTFKHMFSSTEKNSLYKKIFLVKTIVLIFLLCTSLVTSFLTIFTHPFWFFFSLIFSILLLYSDPIIYIILKKFINERSNPQYVNLEKSPAFLYKVDTAKSFFKQNLTFISTNIKKALLFFSKRKINEDEVFSQEEASPFIFSTSNKFDKMELADENGFKRQELFAPEGLSPFEDSLYRKDPFFNNKDTTAHYSS